MGRQRLRPRAISPMPLIDIHTHSPNPFAAVSVVDATDAAEMPRREGVVYSAGIHPRFITPGWPGQAATVSALAASRRIAAIGECGFDRTAATPEGVQAEVFAALARLSAEEAMPMVIHCVRGADMLLRFRKLMPFAGAWVIHGFRGKPAAMSQLVEAGFGISFGAKANAESVRLCPSKSVFLETDTAPHSTLPQIYQSYSALRGEDLEKTVAGNFRNLFSRTPRQGFPAT